MACKLATYYEDDGYYQCSVTDGRCMYMSPDSKRCAEEYGEGPDLNLENNDI